MISKKVSLILFLFFSITVSAQEIEVKEVQSKMSKGVQTGYYVVVPKTNEKNVNRDWKNVMRDHKAKTSNSGKNEQYSAQAKILSLSADPVDVYMVAQESKDGVGVTIFFHTIDGFIGRDNPGTNAREAEIFVRNFAVERLKSSVSDEVKDEEKELKDLEGDLKDLERDKEKLEKKIADAKETIKESEKDIIDNLKDQEKKREEIKKQRERVENKKKNLKEIK